MKKVSKYYESSILRSPYKPTKVKTSIDNTPGRLSSVAAAIRVLKAFSEEEVELGISALAQRLNLAKSTVHRLAATLVAEGLLEQNPVNGRYRLGIALFGLGALVRSRMDVSNQAQPFLHMLRERCGETVHLAIMDQTSIMYLFTLESSQAIRMHSYIGTRKPAFCTSEGRVLLAFGPPEVVQRVVAEELTARTPSTPSNPKALLKILATARADGYAFDDEESEMGMRGIAAPVYDSSGHVVAAVGLCGPTQRLTKKSLRSMLPQLLETTEAISMRLGYRPVMPK
jgi:IclR family transcriptional regulator, KDG regulon repressor